MITLKRNIDMKTEDIDKNFGRDKKIFDYSNFFLRQNIIRIPKN